MPIDTDDMERMLVEIMTGKEPTLRNEEADRIREKLRAECEAIIAAGGSVIIPPEVQAQWPGK